MLLLLEFEVVLLLVLDDSTAATLMLATKYVVEDICGMY
jgi:hypothetical protein